ncbi:hypothetical protein ACA910_010560 [Epithemia clementina (nom. ined.)]
MEASRMDPQHHILMQLAFEAMEDAGISRESLRQSKTGVFIGLSSHDYGDIQSSYGNRATIRAHTNLGATQSLAANRISHAFDLRGPSLVVDTACSSSLVATHLGAQSIWNGDANAAIIGGVNLILKPEAHMGFSKAGMLAPDGRCKSFDDSADGYVRSEGAACVLLKRLDRAIQDGDRVYAVIRGTAVNQDGRDASNSSISVPNEDAQVELLQKVFMDFGVDPTHVGFVEAHGTGTSAGDNIKARALGKVLGSCGPNKEKCWVGSIKSNIGHLEPASGMAGLLKMALALHKKRIPPNLHFKIPNRKIDFDALGIAVPTNGMP